MMKLFGNIDIFDKNIEIRYKIKFKICLKENLFLFTCSV